MSKKVLVLGVGQSNFLSFLYSTLKSFDESFNISVPTLQQGGKNITYDSWMYDNSKVKKYTSLLSHVKAIFSVFFSLHFYRILFFIFIIEGKIKKALHFCVAQINEKAFFIENSNFKDYDTFHFHYMQYSYLRKVFFVPAKKKIVCSFWGSDLLRTSDVFNHYFVQKALQKEE